MATHTRVMGSIALEVAVLLAVVAFVDNTFIRVGLALAVALLLAQRAVGVAPSSADESGPGLPDRRNDQVVRDHVTRLLVRIREFYSTCHLARSQQLSTAEATERIQLIEKDLNRLLAEVVRTSQGGVVAAGDER